MNDLLGTTFGAHNKGAMTLGFEEINDQVSEARNMDGIVVDPLILAECMSTKKDTRQMCVESIANDGEPYNIKIDTERTGSSMGSGKISEAKNKESVVERTNSYEASISPSPVQIDETTRDVDVPMGISFIDTDTSETRKKEVTVKHSGEGESGNSSQFRPINLRIDTSIPSSTGSKASLSSITITPRNKSTISFFNSVSTRKGRGTEITQADGATGGETSKRSDKIECDQSKEKEEGFQLPQESISRLESVTMEFDERLAKNHAVVERLFEAMKVYVHAMESVKASYKRILEQEDSEAQRISGVSPNVGAAAEKCGPRLPAATQKESTENHSIEGTFQASVDGNVSLL